MKSAAAVALSIWMVCLVSAQAAMAEDRSQGHATTPASTGPVTSTSTLRFEPPPPEPSPGSFGRPMVWSLPFWFAMPPVADETTPAVTTAVDTTPAVPLPAPIPAEPSSIQPLLRSVPEPGPTPRAQGQLRLEATPEAAQVFVDGFFTGTVEEVRENSAGLRLASGWHRIELRAPGHETLAFNVTIEPGRTLSVHRDLRPVSR